MNTHLTNEHTILQHFKYIHVHAHEISEGKRL